MRQTTVVNSQQIRGAQTFNEAGGIATAIANARVLTAAGNITGEDHGKTLFLDNTTGFVTTLPMPIMGFDCDVINRTPNTTGNHTIVTNGSPNIIKGIAFNGEAAGVGDSGATDDTISFVANSSLAGDRVNLRSDGTSWFVTAHSKLAASVIFTTAS